MREDRLLTDETNSGKILNVKEIKDCFMDGFIPFGSFAVVGKQRDKTAQHYETVVIPEREERAYSIGFETGKEEARIIAENTITPERMAEAYEKWSQGSIEVRKATAKELIGEIEKIAEVLTNSGVCESDCQFERCAGLFTRKCPKWQQLKQKWGK